MLVKVHETITFPNGERLHTSVIGPHNGRMLLEICGRSGMSIWSEILLTVPEAALSQQEEVALLPGVYRLSEGQDRRGQRLIRFYHADPADDVQPLLLFSVDGFLVPEASSPEAREIARAEGRSRSGRHGERWALIAAPQGAVVAVAPYDCRDDLDPVYYKVVPEGLVLLGTSNAILAPDQW